MKQILITTILVFIFSNINSQQSVYQQPDYDLIQKEIQDSTSNYFYPKLMSRLAQFDTTLILEDYRHLYYGYTFQQEYKPYWTSPDEEKLLKFYRSKKINEKDYDEIIILANHSINEFPFDLRQMNFLGYIYHLKGDEEMAKKVSYRFQGTFDAIMSSGDGKTCESGFHIISVSHEYVFLNMFQLSMISQALTGDCDFLQLDKDKSNMTGIYFNLKRLLDKNLETLK